MCLCCWNRYDSVVQLSTGQKQHCDSCLLLGCFYVLRLWSLWLFQWAKDQKASWILLRAERLISGVEPELGQGDYVY